MDTILGDYRPNPIFLEYHPGMKEAFDKMEIEGVPFAVLSGDIQPGDTYIAERNTGLKLLTCESISEDGTFIINKEGQYSYDTGECIKIMLLID